MALSKDELRAKLMKELGEAVDALVENWEADAGGTLSDIENLALSLGAQVSQRSTQALAESGEEAGQGPVNCPVCGQQARHKGQKTRYLSTRSGEIQVRRGYYYCESCQQGFFPPR